MYDIMLLSIACAPHHIRSDINMLFLTVSKYLNMSVSHREGQCVSNSLGSWVYHGVFCMLGRLEDYVSACIHKGIKRKVLSIQALSSSLVFTFPQT